MACLLCYIKLHLQKCLGNYKKISWEVAVSRLSSWGLLRPEFASDLLAELQWKFRLRCGKSWGGARHANKCTGGEDRGGKGDFVWFFFMLFF